MPANTSKDTVYVDIDDEITAIIDKVKSSDKKIVALVLPKRAAVLQSIVNMKLLKRTTDDAKKNIVLITSEASLLPLAGAVGVHVAKTLQSKPAIPAAPPTADAPISVDQDDIDDVQLDPAKPVGQLAGEEEAIEVDNDDKPEAAAVAGAAAVKSSKKKIKIPNFDKFRVKVVLGVVALLLLVAGWFFAFQVMPKAKVVIQTDASSIDSEVKLTADPAATEVSEDGSVVPATLKETSKTESESVPATGELDKGQKATGSVSLKNCSASVDPVIIPAGTGVSTSNLTFITNEAVTLPATTKNGLNQCTTAPQEVDVTAQNAGDKYNISGDRTFTVAGYSTVTGTDSSAMTGGTSNIVKIVSQKDIDEAKQKIQDRSDAARDELLDDMDAEGLLGLRETFAIKGEPMVTPAPAVNTEASTVKVTIATTYTLLGVKKDDLKKLVEKSVEGKFDASKQEILDDGLDEARVVVDEKKPNNVTVATIKTIVLAGPRLDEEAIKQEIAGKKKNQALTAIKSRPGIKEAEISYSPFWVSSTPKKTSKITVVFEQNTTNEADNEN